MGDNTLCRLSCQSQHSYPTHIKILVESGIHNTSSNISTIPIGILTTILYTSKIYIFLNHNTGTILVYNTGTNFYTSIVIAKYRRSNILLHNTALRQIKAFCPQNGLIRK